MLIALIFCRQNESDFVDTGVVQPALSETLVVRCINFHIAFCFCFTGNLVLSVEFRCCSPGRKRWKIRGSQRVIYDSSSIQVWLIDMSYVKCFYSAFGLSTPLDLPPAKPPARRFAPQAEEKSVIDSRPSTTRAQSASEVGKLQACYLNSTTQDFRNENKVWQEKQAASRDSPSFFVFGLSVFPSISNSLWFCCAVCISENISFSF
jgi:hypothetical protein